MLLVIVLKTMLYLYIINKSNLINVVWKYEYTALILKDTHFVYLRFNLRFSFICNWNINYTENMWLRPSIIVKKVFKWSNKISFLMVKHLLIFIVIRLRNFIPDKLFTFFNNKMVQNGWKFTSKAGFLL